MTNLRRNLSTKNLNYYLTFLFLLLLPFERILTVEIFGFTVKPSYLVALVLLSLIAGKKIKQIKPQKEEVVLLFFVLWSYLTFFWSINGRRTLIFSSLFLLMALIFISVRRIMKTEWREKLFDLLISVGVVLSLFALWQFFGDLAGLDSNFTFLRPEYRQGSFPFPRPQATFLEPLYFANFLFIPIFLSLYKLQAFGRKKYFIFLFLVGLSFFLTLSRGAIFALICALVLYLLINLIKKSLKLKYFLPGIVTLAFSLLAALLLIFASTGSSGTEAYLDQAGKYTDIRPGEESSTSALNLLRTRENTRKIAMSYIETSPFGIGVASFGSLPEFNLIRLQDAHQTVNNQYLEILGEEGFVGLLLFFLFSFLVFVRLCKQISNSSQVWFLSLFAAFLIQYLFFSSLILIYFWTILALIFPLPLSKKGGDVPK